MSTRPRENGLTHHADTPITDLATPWVCFRRGGFPNRGYRLPGGAGGEQQSRSSTRAVRLTARGGAGASPARRSTGTLPRAMSFLPRLCSLLTAVFVTGGGWITPAASAAHTPAPPHSAGSASPPRTSSPHPAPRRLRAGRLSPPPAAALTTRSHQTSGAVGVPGTPCPRHAQRCVFAQPRIPLTPADSAGSGSG
jgi:hypothetical protein